MAVAQTLDPLDDAAAYSLSIGPNGRDRASYFPLGVLFPRDTNELISYGFDFTEQAVSPLNADPNGSNIVQDWFIVRNDRPNPPQPAPNHLGLFNASWSWHMMPIGVAVPGYGMFTQSRSIFDPEVRRFMLGADAALAKDYGAEREPTVMWSFDNEWEGSLVDSPAADAQFVTWLKNAYGTLPALNAAWGTGYSNWTDITIPQNEVHISRPAAWLDWHAVQDQAFTKFMADRYQAVYQNDPWHRGIAQKTTQQSFDLPTVGKQRVLDPAMLCDLTRPYGGWFGVDLYDADDSYIYQVNFAAQCIRPLVGDNGHLFLTETNNHGGPGWQFANSIWRSLGSGVKAYDLFCFGMAGATSDSDIYGLTSPNTLLRDKAPYAARFAYDIRRTEDFWANSRPAAGVPKVAILLNRQDMLLDDNDPNNMWAGPSDSREGVYSALRQDGYWVDVLPYTKLDSTFLKQYNALFLVNSDHLTSAECDAIDSYVRNGGHVVADMLAGYYDEHHRVTAGLSSVLGAKLLSFTTGPGTDVKLADAAGTFTGQDTADVNVDAASTVIERTPSGSPGVVKTVYGSGSSLFVNTRLGALHGDSVHAYNQYIANLLRLLNVLPAYADLSGAAATASLRVEEPLISGRNMALIVANIDQAGHVAAAVSLTLPPGNWAHALWSPAESQTLTPVSSRPLGNGRFEVDLPAFATAGMLLLFEDHAPLISIDDIQTQKHAIDGAVPVLTPGVPQPVVLSIYNPSPHAIAAGSLKVRALQGWRITPGLIHTPPVAPYGVWHVTTSVSAPDHGVLPYAERMYPINVRWSDGTTDRAVTTTPVGVDIDNTGCPWLLSDNALYPADFPRKLNTGATYRYLIDNPALATQYADPAAGAAAHDTALQGGYDRWLIDADSAHFNGPNFSSVAIEFDLKSSYPLHAVRLLSSSFGGFPTKLDVSVSNDDVTFVPVGSAIPAGGPCSGKWLTLSGLEGRTARYVRLNVAMQGGGGYINEVEIWGYPQQGHH